MLGRFSLLRRTYPFNGMIESCVYQCIDAWACDRVFVSHFRTTPRKSLVGVSESCKWRLNGSKVYKVTNAIININAASMSNSNVELTRVVLWSEFRS